MKDAPRIELSKAISVKELYDTKYKELAFEGEWEEHMGRPEHTGSIFVWGRSGHRKTTYVAMFAKYLTNFGRVAYDSLEEGKSKSMREAFKRARMEEVAGKIILLNKEPIAQLRERLMKHKAPNIVVIDSVQVARMKYEDYRNLIDHFPKVLFILVSKAKGKEPRGNAAEEMRYDSNVTVYVEGGRAFIDKSRYGGGKYIDVDPEKAAKYWAEY
jgi:hypothetical protein